MNYYLVIIYSESSYWRYWALGDIPFFGGNYDLTPTIGDILVVFTVSTLQCCRQ